MTTMKLQGITDIYKYELRYSKKYMEKCLTFRNKTYDTQGKYKE